jgi:hypothetical protein
MKTITLITWLSEIDSKLKNRTYKSVRTFIGELSREVIQIPVTKQRYSTDEVMAMYNRKLEIISELHNRGVVDDKGFKEFMLSEGGEFTPSILFSEDSSINAR